jgi:hypothetical protein
MMMKGKWEMICVACVCLPTARKRKKKRRHPAVFAAEAAAIASEGGKAMRYRF